MTSDPDQQTFPLGVASFDPKGDGVLLWTYMGGHRRCAWEVAIDRSFADIVASGDASVSDGSDTVTVDVDGLSQGTRYWYRFTAPDGTRSDIGRTKTLPGEGADRLRIAAVCCARYSQSDFAVYGSVADADVDLVVHLGDYVYEDNKAGESGREPEPAHDCVTIDDYRTRHVQARSDPDARALHAAHPMVVIWDDHDLADNAWRGGAKNHDPKEQGPWTDRLDAALRAQQEFLPKRLADPADLTSAWRRLDAGDLCTLLCTEGRAHRDEQAGNEGSAPADDSGRSLLGTVQARWLEESVVDTSARWAVLLSGTVMSELVLPAPELLDALLPEKYAVVDGCASNTDQWDGYLAERDRVATALARRNGGSLVLSGDIHSSWAIEGPLGPDGVPVAVELVCPPAATTPLGQLFPTGAGEWVAPRFVEQVPGARWADVDHRGFLTVELSRDQAEATWWWVEERVAVQGRRWNAPRSTPPGLVDPEPRVEPDGTPRSPSNGEGERPKPRRARKVASAALVAAAVVGAARWARSQPAGHRGRRS